MVEDENQIRDHEEQQRQTELVVFRQTHRRFDAVGILVRNVTNRASGETGVIRSPQIADSRKLILNDHQRIVGRGNAAWSLPTLLDFGC